MIFCPDCGEVDKGVDRLCEDVVSAPKLVITGELSNRRVVSATWKERCRDEAAVRKEIV